MLVEKNSLINIGLNEPERVRIAERLNVLLANEYLLYTKTLKHHWNVTGPLFGPLHALFNSQYEELLEVADRVAERVRALGFKSLGTAQEFLDKAHIAEQPGFYPDALGMVQDLLEGYELIIRQLRHDIALTAEINDMGSNNFLSDLLEKHEKTAWILRSHLQK